MRLSRRNTFATYALQTSRIGAGFAKREHCVKLNLKSPSSLAEGQSLILVLLQLFGTSS